MILKNTCSNIKITTLTTANYKIQRPNNKYKKKIKPAINTKIILVLESKMLVSIIEEALTEFNIVDERLRL